MSVRLANVFETIMYEYAKLIADRAVEDRQTLEPAIRTGRGYWSFVSRTFKKLSQGELSASAILRENKLLVVQGQQCAYCGANGVLQWEHIVPLSRGGPDSIDNLVLSCGKCNREKGFMHYDLGFFDHETCRLEPIADPFEPKVLPMSPV